MNDSDLGVKIVLWEVVSHGHCQPEVVVHSFVNSGEGNHLSAQHASIGRATATVHPLTVSTGQQASQIT